MCVLFACSIATVPQQNVPKLAATCNYSALRVALPGEPSQFDTGVQGVEVPCRTYVGVSCW